MAKVERSTALNERFVYYGFHCPACDERHAVCTARQTPGEVHAFNGSLDLPTFYPAILVPGSDADPVAICHFYIELGRIRYLSDCTHPMAGKNVELPDID